MNPWFTHPARRLTVTPAGTEAQRALPSGRLRVQVLEGEVLADIDVPSGLVTIDLLGSAAEHMWPGVGQEIDANSIAVGFEERGSGELPRYEPWAANGSVDAVRVRVGAGHTSAWDVTTITGQRRVGPVTLWISDLAASEALRNLQDFYVRRTTRHQPGVGSFTHAALDGLFLNVAQHQTGTDDGRVRLWTGRDSAGEVREIVVDLAAGSRRVEPAPGVDPWLQPVFGGLRLQEDADLSSLIGRVEPFWIPAYVPGTGVGVDEGDARVLAAREDEGDEHYLPAEVFVRPVGSIPLAGELMLGTMQRGSDEHEPMAVRLGLSCDSGVYPLFLVDDPSMGDTGYLVRFDVGIPVRWSYAPGVVGEGWSPLDEGGVCFFTDETPDDARLAPATANRPVRWNGQGSAALIVQPDSRGHSDPGVFEVYVGYDDSDLPVAILLDVVNVVAGDMTHVASPDEL